MGDKEKPNVEPSYVCKQCGAKLKVMQHGYKTGLYCAECGTWDRWLTSRDDVWKAYNTLVTTEDIRGKAIKKYSKYGGNTIIRCEKCDCQLYSAIAPKPLGQFDLLNANFCPKCGVEFVDSQKKFRK